MSGPEKWSLSKASTFAATPTSPGGTASTICCGTTSSANLEARGALARRAGRRVGKGVGHRREGWCGPQIGVERQWPRGQAVLAPFRLVGFVADDPAMPVGQAPGDHHLDRRLVERRV